MNILILKNIERNKQYILLGEQICWSLLGFIFIWEF